MNCPLSVEMGLWVDISVILLHPGFVRTDVIGHAGFVSTDESVQGLLARLDELNLETSGEFWHQMELWVGSAQAVEST